MLLRIVLALAALAVLAFVLVRQHRTEQMRWSIVTSGDPGAGARLFEERGCGGCHAVSGMGSGSAPALGVARAPRLTLGQFVASMWTHAPKMWERMQAEGIRPPELTKEDVAHLFAFLDMAQLTDSPGDAVEGRRLFCVKGCGGCHSAGGKDGGSAPDLVRGNRLNSAFEWGQAMWNHAPAMQALAQTTHITWPRFEQREMNDVVTYLRQASGAGPAVGREARAGDQGRGWQLFQASRCIECHSVDGHGGKAGPELGRGPTQAMTPSQFAGSMWNHSPEMWASAKQRGIRRHRFEAQQMADLYAFLSGLRNREPEGSPYVGKTVFAERGCAACHGADAEGGRGVPALRGRGTPVTSISLAASLWNHGTDMNLMVRGGGQSWRPLTAPDVGNLVAYLNEPPVKRR